ncbi:MBL fold metallo-hydrolase [Rhodohalobacter sp. 8-1]|uniref:MBL fold metallo-hydrolase n=1 Tax=Rhodohalobacter sp. 8-1 TaxID=3131972 RepID=UPI0030EF5156
MDIKRFEVGPFAENTYLLTQNETSLLIDPGFSNDREFKAFRAKLADSNTRLSAILLTHAHIDHVLGLPVVLDAFDVDVYLSHEDLHPWKHISEQAKMFGITAGNLDFTPKELPSDQSFSVDQFEMELLYTPGHAPDHISFYFEKDNMLIAGDTLFKQSVGRTDLYKGSSDLLRSSIKDKLYSLPDDTVVYPGHGPETTIGEEKKANPFVTG